MPIEAFEVNFEGLVGPSYAYAALAVGNMAAAASAGRVSKPRAAALEGLEKIEQLMRLGVRQAVLPPLMRPNLRALHRIGLLPDEGLLQADDYNRLATYLGRASTDAPHLLAACFSASSVWAANSATVSPSADTQDRKVHLTPANMISNFHRSVEAEETSHVLRQVFDPKSGYFVHHSPLPAADQFGDEGAANHLRFAVAHGNRGLNVFVYGREWGNDPARRYRARQTRQACEAIARLHGVTEFLAVKQNPSAIDAGVFHNDVIATANLDCFFFHEKAFEDTPRMICEISSEFYKMTGHSLRLLEVRSKDLSLEEVVSSYLLNSQIVRDSTGRTLLIAPVECRILPAARRFLANVCGAGGDFFDDIIYTDLTSSMRNGGGPACLRLRVVLTEEELMRVKESVLVEPRLIDELKRLIVLEYPSELRGTMFTEPDFIRKCFETTRSMYRVLNLAPLSY